MAKLHTRVLSIALAAMMLVMHSAPSYAQGAGIIAGTVASAATAATAATTSDVCTNIQANKAKAFSSASGTLTGGLLSQIYLFIVDVVGKATENLFKAFTNNAAYKQAVFGAMTLMVVFFGIAFTIGIVQVSFAQVLTRLIKVGLIASIISPTGWTFFSDYVVKFFMTGTDDLVKGVMEIGTGIPVPTGATPFYHFDRLADFLIQPDTVIQIIGSIFAGGPFGMAMGGLMAIATWGFVQLLIKSLRLYAVTFVGRSLLLGIAPLFIVFLLFDRTRQLFMSWLNALLSMALQPILLFTFLSFFIVLIESAAKDMMDKELCWTEFTNISGTVGHPSFWRFKDDNGLQTSTLTFQGTVQCLVQGSTNGKECPVFPVNIVDVLSFLILVYIAQRFAEVIDRIANELSNTFISLDAGGKIDQFMTQASSSLTANAGAPKPAKKP